MSTQQPVWRLMANLGDVNPIDHGGLFVYVDDTGVYAPELEKLDSPDEDPADEAEAAWTVYRVSLDRCTYVAGILSDNASHPDYPVWFADKLDTIASSDSYPDGPGGLLTDLCGSNVVNRAHAWRAVFDYYGWEEGDHSPMQLTRAAAEARYASKGVQA